MGVRLSDKVVLLTGAGRGIGEALALSLAAQGASLALQDLSPLNIDRLAEQIKAAGGQARPYLFDIAKGMPAQALVDQVLADWGRLDCVVHCATIELTQEVLRVDEWDWHRTLDLNLTAAYLLLQALGRLPAAAEGRLLVNVAVRQTDPRDSPGAAVTLASLSGLLGLTRQAAREVPDRRLAVCAISAGIGEPVGTRTPASLFGQVARVLQALLTASPQAVNGVVIDLDQPGQLESRLPPEVLKHYTEVKDERTHNDPG